MRLLARLAYVLGDPGEALAQQHKATLVSERCNGIDHANTLLEYVRIPPREGECSHDCR
jgi:protein TIF31